ncbi:MAG: hypothetical protein ACM3L6_04735 [Deltaproteobacteria bacterium]
MFFILFFTFLGFLAGLIWTLRRQGLTFGKAVALSLKDIFRGWTERGGPDLFHEGRWYRKRR